MADSKNMKNIYPLAPLQEGLLFETLLNPGSGVYINVLYYTLKGRVNPAAIEQAWNAILKRHDIFRTGFAWENKKRPLQIVFQTVDLPFSYLDWTSTPEAEKEERLGKFINTKRSRGFDLSRAPLMDVTLIKMAEDVYRMIWCLHHILLDGWSGQSVIREFFSIYDCLAANQLISLKDAKPYSDYIQWIQKQDISKAQRYWRDLLRGFTIPTPLPLDKTPHSNVSITGDFRTQTMYCPEELTEKLQTFTKNNRITMNSLVQGVWGLILSRYAGQDDIVFGSVSSGREIGLPGIEEMVGLFINTLPARMRIPEADAALASWLQDIQVQQTATRQYEYSSLSKVKEWSDVPHNMFLFDSTFVFENYPIDRLSLKHERSITIESSRASGYITGYISYPLHVRVFLGENRLSVTFLYDACRFNAWAIDQILKNFQTLFESIVSGHNQKIGDLKLLTQEEGKHIFFDFNKTDKDYPEDKTIHQLFEEQVKRTPHNTAVVFGDKSLTYEELNAEANRLAHYLRGEKGIKPDTLVAVCMDRSPEMIIAILGILKSGGAYLPIDPNHPKDRILHMLEDSNAPVFITQSSFIAELPQNTKAYRIFIDTDWARLIVPSSTKNPSSIITPHNLAYCMYTSGSTGKAKGVRCFHRGVIEYLSFLINAYNLNETDVIMQITSIVFDPSVRDIFGPLLVGAKIVLLLPTRVPDPSEVARKIQDDKITKILSIVPSFLAEVLKQANTNGDYSALEHIFSCGEALPIAMCREGEKVFGKKGLFVNQYGPTECTMVASTYMVKNPERIDAAIALIGKPTNNRKLYILDPDLEPVPIGVPGELHIGGAGLARDYLNRPDLTAERFIPDPFTKEEGERLYKTGDFARYLPDGNIEFLGRIDFQVKIRGFRIELGEIEASLREHATIKDVVVTSKEDLKDPDIKHLIAYIVPKDTTTKPTVTDLKDYLKKELPDYMIPSLFVWLDILPLTPNGKIDRKALPLPDNFRPGLEITYAPPESALELELVEKWQRVLNVEPVGIQDDFFELGGDSLSAIRLFSEMKKVLGREIPLQLLFAHPTIKGIAEALQKNRVTVLVPHIIAIQPHGSKPPLFCVPPLGSSGVTFLELSRTLGKDQPFYSLNRSTFEIEEKPDITLQEIAAFYIHYIRSVQAEGPYYLAGWCEGGRLAYEIAQQLLGSGHDIAFLGMFETRWIMKINRYIYWFFVIPLWFFRLSLSGKIAYLKVKAARVKKALFGSYEKKDNDRKNISPENYFNEPPPEIEDPEITAEVNERRNKAIRQYWQRYIPKSFAARVTLFITSQSEAWAYSAYAYRKDWKKLASGGLEEYVLPGGHITYFREPYVKNVAAQLEACLKRARSAKVS